MGFALETHDEEAHARKPNSRKKNFDFIVLNSLRDAGAGFPRRHQQGDLRLAVRDSEALPLLAKREVAARIADKIEEFFAR